MTLDEEIKHCIKMLRDSDADTGFMHESFHKDNPADFTRTWFAWVNTLFGELILKLEKENKKNRTRGEVYIGTASPLPQHGKKW